MAEHKLSGALVDRGLRIRLGLFLLISLIILAFIGKDVWQGDIGLPLAGLGLLLGTGIGVLLGRLLTIRWHETRERVVSELDVVGGIGIALYIAAELSRNWIFGHFIHGPALGAFTLALLAGALFGRFLGMRMSIVRVLRGQGVVD
ncbi:MAG: hypothetical protein WDN10_04255 [bacterium]